MNVRQLTTHFEGLIKNAETNILQLFDEKNQNVQKIENFETVAKLSQPPPLPPKPPKPPKIFKEQIVPRNKGQNTHIDIYKLFICF